MESRKRLAQVSSNPSPIEVKKRKNSEKENSHQSDEDSNDSFDNFCNSHVEIQTKNEAEKSPRSRGKKIEILENNDDDDNDGKDDSFDISFSNEKSKIISKKKESEVDGFPSINSNENVLYLKVINIEKREESDCLDIECLSNNQQFHIVYLQDRWSNSKIKNGNMINIINAKKWAENDFIVDDSSILIINPDVLVPCTATASSTFCARKVILNEKFKCGNGMNKAMLLGTIMHGIFQMAALTKKRPITENDLIDIWKSQTSKYAEELVALSFTPNCLNTELKPYLEIISNWINKHIPTGGSKFFKKQEKLPTKSNIVDVYDVEENIWDTKLGLKGKIDLTLKVNSEDGKKQVESLELKTGKSGASVEHMGQVLLYCMMLSSRYDQPVKPGNLLYLKDGISRCVVPKSNDLLAILQQRNNLSQYYEDIEDLKLPEPRKDSRFCDKCDHKIMCTFTQKNRENYSNSSEEMIKFAENEMAHLNSKHIEYANNWLKWILTEWKLENDRTESNIKEIWLKPIEEREKQGKCLKNLSLEKEEIRNSQKIAIYLKKENKNEKNDFKPGDVAILSSEKLIAISFVIIGEINETNIQIFCDKKIEKRYSGPFILDKYSSTSIYATTLGNLYYFMQNNEIGRRLRDVLVDLIPPTIVNFSSVDFPTSIKKIIVQAKLNKEQRMAVIHALSSENYTIVEGLPGSGKTTLISILIQCLLKMGKSILMTAFTHSAVDNIILKLRKDVSSESILRLGSQSSIKEENQDLSLNSKLKNVEADNYYSNLKKIMKNTPIVACTCHHVPRELLFSYRQFDVLIVDEASMVLEPLILPVLATSLKFVLVGDCQQLTPLVLSKKSRLEGAEISTMEKLQKAHKNVIVSLTSQYRMNEKISKLASNLFYENRLICGNELIAKNCLIKNENYKKNANLNEKKYDLALDENIENSVVFIDTKSDENQMMKCVDCENGGGVQNQGEAEIVGDLCENLMKNGLKPEEIGVMSAYRKQVDRIRQIVEEQRIEVNTIDSYQGREKNVIILATTWTQNSQKKSDLLRDERRVNVGLTRSKQKLILIGCKKSLETIPVMNKMLKLIENQSTINQ